MDAALTNTLKRLAHAIEENTRVLIETERNRKADADRIFELNQKRFEKEAETPLMEQLFGPQGEKLTHDEDTLTKVREAIESVLSTLYPGPPVSDQQAAINCISEMQNRGILFRERAS